MLELTLASQTVPVSDCDNTFLTSDTNSESHHLLAQAANV